MNIGIIGSGSVGGTLGTRWAQGGHQVVFSSADSNSQKMKDLVARAGANARAASVDEAAKASDVLLLATPWAATESAIASAGDVQGKVLIDATNPLLSDLSGLCLGTDRSAGEQVQLLATGAKVAKEIVKQLATELGFDPLDAGPLVRARALEPLALLWISLAYPSGYGTDIAFRFVRR